MKQIIATILLNCLLQFSTFAQTTIAEARAAAIGATVSFRGIITNGGELGTIRYVQDLTAGLAIYDFNQAASMMRGDSVLVTGTVTDYNGLLEINPVSSLTILNSGNTLPDPLVVTIPQISENYEGMLIRINGIVFDNAGATFAGNTSYGFSSNGETMNIYVRNGSPLIGQTIPASTIDMVGIASQYLVDYQVLPRDMLDFLIPDGINITTAVTQTNLSQSGFTLNWSTDMEGTSGVNYGLTPALELGEQSDASLAIDHALTLTGLEAGQIYYCQAFSVANGDTAFSQVKPFGVVSLSSGNMIAYFNSTVDNSVSLGSNATQLYQAIDDTLIAYINRAEATLDLTIYDFNNTDISNISMAINAAANRGVQVRFISDGSLAPTNSGITDLAPVINHIYSPTSSAYNIMHNKFVVIDAAHSDPMKPLVWTGSTNWTDRQINRDNNSVIIVQDQTLARAYTIEFNEMWGSEGPVADTSASRFGSFKTDNTPHDFIIGGKKVESYFSPSDNVNSQLINTIDQADSNAYFASMLITRSDVAQALVDESAAGAEVMGIIDNITSTTQYGLLSGQLTSNELFVNADPQIIMHHKYLITDHGQDTMDPTLWVGSHNWSTNANTRNDENTLVIHDADLVDQYYQEFYSRISVMPTAGCTDALACNYDSTASVDDGSCLVVSSTCDDGDANTMNDIITADCTCSGVAIVNGCTNTAACNYLDGANMDDGSCLFVGDACDDGNALTTNDSIGVDCMCAGIVNSIGERTTDNSNVSIYPNPTSGITTLEWSFNLSEKTSIEIYDVLGNCAMKKSINCNAGKNRVSYDFSELPSGKYTLVVRSSSRMIRSSLIVQ
jgi:phosphatidylserine/phosphatidylglycerophosphate/cardiolipin synthase-like enzyme